MPMTSKEVEKLLLKNGWVHIRTKGSHKIFKAPNSNNTIPLPMHSTDLPIGTLNNILKRAGLK